MYDYIVIGAGIAGSYFAYSLSERGISNYLLIEKNADIGGRMLDWSFHGNLVHLGAAFVRSIDERFLKLLAKLQIPIKQSNLTFDYKVPNFDPVWYNSELDLICKDLTQKYKETDSSFIEYLKTRYINTPELLNKFLNHSSFTDFRYASAKAFLDYVPEDLKIKPQEFYIIEEGWKPIFQKLSKKFDNKKVKLNTEVTNISFNTSTKTWKVTYEESEPGKFKTVETKNIIITHSCHFKLFDKSVDKQVFPKIFTIPFMKIYTFHKQSPVKEPTVVANQLKKIIPISENVLWSTYNDTDDTEQLRKLLESSNGRQTKVIEDKLEEFFNMSDENAVKDMMVQYWKEGTHGYEPGAEILEKQFWYPSDRYPGLTGVGEAFSKSQGWIEGALHSVESWFTHVYSKTPIK